MANKYLIHGATYCGDGTASNEAASAGAAGAWNDINVLEGTAPAYGVPAAGDVVYIRSKTSGGSDITRVLGTDTATTVTLGLVTTTSPVTWVVDAGTVWSGINGTLKYQSTVGGRSVTLRANNIFKAETQDKFAIQSTVASPANTAFLYVYGHLINALVDATAKTDAYGLYFNLYSGAVLESPHIKWGNIGGSQYGQVIKLLVGQDKALVINPNIELLGSVQDGAVFWVDNGSSGAPQLLVIGGEISGSGAASGSNLVKFNNVTQYAGVFRSVGLVVPRSMNTVMKVSGQGQVGNSVAEIINADSLMGCTVEHGWGFVTSRTDNNPPVLQATLPDSAGTKWSFRIYPQYASYAKPMHVSSSQLYTDTPAAKTITLEILVANTFTGSTDLTKSNTWMTVEYVDDTTGDQVHLSTQDFAGGSLDASTADWSATVWGSVTLVKKKIAITTPSAIKQNTAITVTLHGKVASVNTDDILFVDPDFGVA